MMTMKKIAARALFISAGALFGVNSAWALLRTVTPEQVQQVAARYFGDDQLTVATLLPQPLDAKPRRAAPAAGAPRH